MMQIPWMGVVLAATALGQPYQPFEANLKAREWFQNARFGMFRSRAGLSCIFPEHATRRIPSWC
jgi:uncharacterized membrane protein